MRCNKRNCVFLIGVLFLLVCVGLGLLCVVLWNNPYSLLYKSRTFDRNKLISELLSDNKERYHQSKAYLKQVEPAHLKDTHSKETKELVVGIITVTRKYNSEVLGYLTQTVATTHRIFPKESAEIAICNTDTARHAEAIELSQQFTVYDRFTHKGEDMFDTAKPNHPRLIEGRFTENGYLKEKDDYLFCLEKLLQHQSKLIVVLEDDAVPMADFFVDLKTYILPKLNYYYPSWGYVKLYYPPKWLGYANEVPRLIDLFYTAGLGALAVTLSYIVLKLLVSFRRHLYRFIMNMLCSLKMIELLVIFIIGFLASLAFVLVIGRQNVLELQRMFYHYSIIPSPACCTQAMMYKPNTVTEMVNYLRNVKCTSKYAFDIAQHDFSKNKTIDAYLIEPSIVRHIGLFSSIQGKGVKGDLSEFINLK